MKHALLICALTCCAFAFGQKAKVTSASFKLQDKEYLAAAEFIDAAIADPKTGIDPKTWYIRTQIYKEMSRQTDEQYLSKRESALSTALESSKKVIELDVKKKYADKIIVELFDLYNGYFEKAQQLREKSDWKNALIAFKQTEAIQTLADQAKPDALPYNMVVSYFISETALNATDTATAIETFESMFSNPKRLTAAIEQGENAIKTQKLIAEKSGQTVPEDQLVNPAKQVIEVTVQNYVGVLNNRKQYDKALQVTKLGSEIVPGSQNIVIQELNVYLASNRQEEAVSKFETAVAADPKNANLKFALGTVYEKLQEKAVENKNEAEAKSYLDKAVSTYTDAIAVDPKNFFAYYNLGVLYYNQGVEKNKKMNDLPLSAKAEYDKLDSDRKLIFKQSLPFLEKAHEVNPEEKTTMSALKEVYFILGDLAKNKEMKQKLGQ